MEYDISELDVDPDDVSESTSVKVDPHEKIQWIAAVNEVNEYDTLSHLITTAVRHELDENFGFLDQQQSQSQEVTVDLTNIEETLESMEQRLSRIEADIDTVTDERTPDAEIDHESDEFFRIAGQVHDNLPLVNSEEELQEIELALQLPINERAKITGYIEDIAAAIGEDESVVRDAAMYLTEQYARVNSIVDDGQRRFYELDTNNE